MLDRPPPAPEPMPWPDHVPAELRTAWQAAQSEHERAVALLDVAYFLEGWSKWEAVEMHRHATAYAMKTDDHELICSAILSLAYAQAEAMQLSEAYRTVNSAIRLAREHNQPECIFNALNVRGFIRMNAGDERGARLDFRQILHAEGGSKELQLHLVARGNLAKMALAAQQADLALHHLDVVREIMNTIQAEQEALGTPYKHYDIYDLITSATEALAHTIQATQWHDLGREQAMHDAVRKAWERIDNTRQLLSKTEDLRQRMRITVTAAQLCRLLGDLPRSDEYVQEAVRLSRELGHTANAEAVLELARYYTAAERWQDALEAYRQSLGIIQRAGNLLELRAVNRDMAAIHERLGDLPAANEALKQALLAAEKTMERLNEIQLIDEEDEQFLTSTGDTEPTWSERLHLAEHKAQHDPLTGLLNRYGLEVRLAQLPPQSVEPLFVVALLDLDHFKRVNDQFMHAVGDVVLKTVAHLLTDLLPSDTLIARHGGEEFVVVMQVKAAQQAQAMLEQCRLAVLRHDWSRLLPGITQTISIGFAQGRPTEYTELLNQADEELYRAKQAGRNRVLPHTV